MMFLTANQLKDLTGYRKPALQRRWLAENGYSFDVRADGRPVVSRTHYENRHEGPTVRQRTRPNLAALDQVG